MSKRDRLCSVAVPSLPYCQTFPSDLPGPTHRYSTRGVLRVFRRGLEVYHISPSCPLLRDADCVKIRFLDRVDVVKRLSEDEIEQCETTSSSLQGARHPCIDCSFRIGFLSFVSHVGSLV